MMDRASLRGDVIAAYVSAACRIGAWAVVSAIVYRLGSPDEFAALALIRGTIGILNYTAVGLSPALIRLFAEARHPSIGRPSTDSALTERSIYSTGLAAAGASLAIGLILAGAYVMYFHPARLVAPKLAAAAPAAVMLIALGTLLRLFSDAPSALLQTRGRIALDHYLLAGADVAWLLATAALAHWKVGLLPASATFALASLLLAFLRLTAASGIKLGGAKPSPRAVRWTIVRRLLGFGSFVLLAQLAEYFYAPTDYLLIDRFLSASDVAAYAPGVQIDMGLLMLVTGLAAVILPRTALEHAARNPKAVRRYFVRGTLASTALLAIAATGVWVLSPLIFRIWFGPHPPSTHRILDLVLIGTVVGGSSAVGRSVLIGMGKIKTFTLAAILAGALNVIASFCLVKYAHLGLRGILYGTVLAVVGRCAIWMPWYVLRTLGREDRAGG